MRTQNFIAIEELCRSHDIEISFISSLQQTGLLSITTIENQAFIDAVELAEVEKYIRFRYELDINLEGIDAIVHLLKRINDLQQEVSMLRNRLTAIDSAW